MSHEVYDKRDGTELGRRIRVARASAGKTQQDIANMLGVVKQTISQWETGVAYPGFENLQALAHVLGKSVAELTDGIERDQPADESIRQRLAASSMLVPLFGLNVGGGVLMGLIENARPDRFIPTFDAHSKGTIAIHVEGRAMEPRFKERDVNIVDPDRAPEPETFVYAYADGHYVFRQWIPKVHGTTDGGHLRASNNSYPDIIMQPGDKIIGVVCEHLSRNVL